jgi:hypothetical protein
MTGKAKSIERCAERKPFGAEIELRRTRGMKYRVTVRDLSPQGCSINLVDRVQLDEIIWIKFSGLESLEADVCWTKDFIAGVEFRKFLHPSVFAMILDRQAANPA